MTEYYYPNEINIVVENSVRVAYLKPNWREIRKENTAGVTFEPRDETLAQQMLEAGLRYLDHRSVKWNRMIYEEKNK